MSSIVEDANPMTLRSMPELYAYARSYTRELRGACLQSSNSRLSLFGEDEVMSASCLHPV